MNISNWFISLDPTLRVYWGIAIFSTIIFVIQTAMSFIGMGDIDSGSADVDFSTDSEGLDDVGIMHLISIRNAIYFLLGMGWSGISFWNTIPNRFLLAVVAILIGCCFVALFIFISKSMMKLESSGNFDINDAKGKVVSVYLRIPAAGQGMGKVQVSFNGSVQELDARTEGDGIPSGAKVRVEDVIDNKILVVSPER